MRYASAFGYPYYRAAREGVILRFRAKSNSDRKVPTHTILQPGGISCAIPPQPYKLDDTYGSIDRAYFTIGDIVDRSSSRPTRLARSARYCLAPGIESHHLEEIRPTLVPCSIQSVRAISRPDQAVSEIESLAGWRIELGRYDRSISPRKLYISGLGWDFVPIRPLYWAFRYYRPYRLAQ